MGHSGGGGVTNGKHVQLFLTDGMPGGLLTAEIMNWTGHVVAAPRSDLPALLTRPEVSRTGIYILLGDDPDSLGGQLAYIGEADDVRRRLNQHARSEPKLGKDFWDRAIVLTSKDANLTKAHARYLESRFISLALEASRSKLTNSTTPASIMLPEADASDMEYFIAQSKILLPVLGVNIFRSALSASSSSVASEPLGSISEQPPIFELHAKEVNIVARAKEVDGEFIVLKGSKARFEWTSSHPGYRSLRQKLEQDGTLAPSEDRRSMTFGHDQVFSSPSAAAAVILGRAANGRTEWKLPDSTSYGDWQYQGVENLRVDRDLPLE